ncbi:MAG: hemolysin family protein [Desulfobacterales bacterium]|jgi:CBS domain containing-hemolysin-like protein
MTGQYLLLIALILLSGFFSSAETALFSISKARARYLAKTGDRAFKLIKKMKENPHRLLSTILIGNNLVNIGASALATVITIRLVSSHAVGITTGVMTLLILVFGEIFPKSLANHNNVLIARLVIRPIYWLSLLFYPIILFLNFIPLVTGKIKHKSIVTEEELMTFVEVVEEEGEIKEQEKVLIHNIFEFDDTNASEIMTPRADMFVIETDEKLDLEKFVESGYTRFPVIEGDIDHVIGILNIKDLFLHYVTTNGETSIRKIMQPPYFVPENKKLDSLLQAFKKRKQHMAIVVDEHGGVSGLITLEDALEEIVGEITDETDKDQPQIIKIKADEWVVPGKSEIEEVNEKIPMNILESKDYDTFSGYVLNSIERIPKEREEIQIGNFLITVKEMDGNRIREYIVRQQNQVPEPENL